MAEAKFYTYIHKKADTGEVFYVGKGCGYRAHNKQGRSNYWRAIVKKHGYTVDMLEYFDDEQKALDHEIMTIRKMRSEGIILCNLTDGGDGVSGYVRPQESIDRIKAAWKNPELIECHKKNLIAIRIADPSIDVRRMAAQAEAAKRPEVRKKQSDAMKGRKKSPEHIAAVAASHKRPDVAARVSAAIKAALADPEVRKKMSEGISNAKKGKPTSDKQKLSMANPETQLKRSKSVSASIKIWWEKRKQNAIDNKNIQHIAI